MLLIGKPGSGKTYMVQRLLKDACMYKGRFDYVFVMSPSVKKIGIPVKRDQQIDHFSIAWLFEKIAKVNSEQLKRHDK